MRTRVLALALLALIVAFAIPANAQSNRRPRQGGQQYRGGQQYGRQYGGQYYNQQYGPQYRGQPDAFAGVNNILDGYRNGADRLIYGQNSGQGYGQPYGGQGQYPFGTGYDTPDRGHAQATQNNVNMWGLANLLGTGVSGYIQDRRASNRDKQLRRDLANTMSQEQVIREEPSPGPSRSHPTDGNYHIQDVQVERPTDRAFTENGRLCNPTNNSLKVFVNGQYHGELGAGQYLTVANLPAGLITVQ